MHIFKGLTWIYIKVVKLITIHVLIILHSSCLIYLDMFRLINMGIAEFVNNVQRTQGLLHVSCRAYF